MIYVNVQPLITALEYMVQTIGGGGEWHPKWKVNDSSRPQDSYYEWLDPITGETRFGVDVKSNGIIKVLKDDWLSKYTMAIHGTFNVDSLFLRVRPYDREFEDIINKDRIYENEYLLHIPTYVFFYKWVQAALYQEPDYPFSLPDEITDILFLEDLFRDDPLGIGNESYVLDVIDHVFEFLSVEVPLGTVLQGLDALARLAPVFTDELRNVYPDLVAEKFYARIVAITYWVFTERDISSSAHMVTNRIDPSDPNKAMLTPFIPSLPFIINPAFASPDIWLLKHGNLYRRMSDADIEYRLSSMKDIWEEAMYGATATESIFRSMDKLYIDAGIVTKGGRPNLSKATYKKELRTYGKRELTVKEFFDRLCKSFFRELKRDWRGASSVLTYLENFINDPDKHYQLDQL